MAVVFKYGPKTENFGSVNMKVLVLSLGELSKLPETQFGARVPSPLSAIRSSLSPAYITQMVASCLRLLTHWIVCALAFAFANAGNKRPARIAITAMTTSNSMRVKPASEPPARTRRQDIKGFWVMIDRNGWTVGIA